MKYFAKHVSWKYDTNRRKRIFNFYVSEYDVEGNYFMAFTLKPNVGSL